MSLDVYLHGERIGTLARVGADFDYEFEYSASALERYGPGKAVLSTSLPTREEPFSPGASRAYVEGLLPTGMRRLKLARELEVEPADGYALIAALGADCVGGASFLPPVGPPPCPSPESPVWVREDELEQLVAAPPPQLFDPARPQRMRAVLPGIRHKISLARPRPDSWAWPTADLPSTHIVKPETGEHAEMVPNEMFCTTVLAEAGLLVPPTAIEVVGGRRCLVTERFDRTSDRPQATRLHQESFCQALSFEPGEESHSEDAAGPGFGEACGLLRALGQAEKVTDLLMMALCNYILGNGDCHGENFAVMVIPEGSLLAPFHDVLSSAVYDDPAHVGMTITDDYSDAAYLLELAEVCEQAAIDFEHCRRVAAEVSSRMSTALEVVGRRARREGWYAPVVDRIREFADERAVNLGYEVQY
ncbi:MAG TPA: HipA domain-containing protein [Solirubrobacterales bacterium]|nr:HipA domain-containing protein [Solirubrobacterales bacterium]